MAEGGVRHPLLDKDVKVYWRDVVAVANGWVPRAEASAEMPPLARTRGLLISASDVRLVVAQTDSDDQINGYKSIPISWVERVVELREVKPRASGGSTGTRVTRKSPKGGSEPTKASPTTTDSQSS